MATATTFRASAGRLDEMADQMLTAFRAVDQSWDDRVVKNCNLQVRIEAAVSTMHADVSKIATNCQALADECRRRAIICDAYSDHLAVYEQSMRTYHYDMREWRADPDARSSDRPIQPHRPQSPAPWVTPHTLSTPEMGTHR